MDLSDVAIVVSIINGCAAIAVALVQIRDRWRKRG
jgi:hypothetical protein